MGKYPPCPVCGNDLLRRDEPVTGTCSLCGCPVETNNVCKNGHVVCNSCWSKPLFMAATELCIASTSSNPLEIAEKMMDMPGFGMGGCAHAMVVPYSLITAYINAYGGISIEKQREMYANIRRRIVPYPTSMCKIGGVCGILLTAGIGFIDFCAAARPELKPHAMANHMTSECLHMSRKYSPPEKSLCCKCQVYLSLVQSTQFVDKTLNIKLAMSEHVSCKYSAKNPDCNGQKCVMYTGMRMKPLS